MKKIDFEAHFYSQSYMDAMYQRKGYPRFIQKTETEVRKLWYFPDVGQPFSDGLLDPLMDLGEKRLAKMDQNGVDVQVLSLSAPGIEQLEPELGISLATRANDELAEVIRKFPGRFMGFAALAPKDPVKAADELERCVTRLGFVGWNTHSNYGDSYLDDKKYWPILERAEKLGVPIYLHPTVPAIPQLRTYGFALAGAPFGFGIEAATLMMRLIYSGVLDKYPKLTFILGHLGETFPFLIKRIDWAYVRPFDPKSRPDLKRKPSEYLRENVYFATSGNYYEPAFNCTVEAVGIDRIILGTDYPYEALEETMDFIKSLKISEGDKNKVCSSNASRLLKGIKK